MTPAQHIEKARYLLAGGRHALAGEFADIAGREAYLAALHAASAYVITRTGKQPKTHSGTRSEFARLARDEPRIDPAWPSFLGRAYELKDVADYEAVTVVTQQDGALALDEAAQFIEVIAGLV